MEDGLEHIWSPWRMEYIRRSSKSTGCIFCNALKHDSDEYLIVKREPTAFVILNRYPYTSGHVMCVPYAHVSRLQDLPQSSRAEMMELVNQSVQVLQKVYHPEGFNVGMNLGEAAGAGVADHLHMHIVPRWGGDTNFMSAVGRTRVLPELLEDTYQRVKEAW
mgnify:CR=1 FL=1